MNQKPGSTAATRPGAGSSGGGAGQGLQLGAGGGTRPEAKDGDTENQPETLNGGGRGGVTVATILVEGEAPAGDARVSLQQAVEASSRIAESDLDRQRVPATLRQLAEDYFDRLKGRTED